ncbi:MULTISPECIES: response regulator transcription factor [unclassified Duganella]|uniref:response regulator n=1 Tax=unclassified Duganella TaxID=2636909 RepID=UPI000E347355|nr:MULTISPECIES: response regulator transcription factor [unclassified Duganella]RFP18704.1 DNA-binding response regulator [Duganella sp. BJB475]RFP35369.1 DNA-binding response regulator [Duganella sp. BJB476]
MRVLLVEDDDMVGEAMQLALRQAHCVVDWIRDGKKALEALFTNYDMVLLDLGLPGCDGMTVMQTLQQNAPLLPVVIVSARDALGDRVRGLDLGADDYILKPFDMPELLARMRSVQRRYRKQNERHIGTDAIRLNLDSLCMCVGEFEAPLSQREASLMQALLARPGAIRSREALEREVYQGDDDVSSNALEFLIYSIRRKFGQSTIRNVRGMGWAVAK